MKTAAFPQELAEQSDEVRTTVAHNLDVLLKQQRWSRRKAATALGLTHTYVNSRAAGDTDLSASDLAMFAKFLQVDVSEFFKPRTLVPKVAGSTPVGGTLIPFPTRERASVARPGLAPITPLAVAR